MCARRYRRRCSPCQLLASGPRCPDRPRPRPEAGPTPLEDGAHPGWAAVLQTPGPAIRPRPRHLKWPRSGGPASGPGVTSGGHHLAGSASALTAALRLLDRPQHFFQEPARPPATAGRRPLSSASTSTMTTSRRCQRPIGDPHAAGRIWLTAPAGDGRRTERRQANSPDTSGAEAPQGCWADSLASVSLDTGSSRTVLVGCSQNRDVARGTGGSPNTHGRAHPSNEESAPVSRTRDRLQVRDQLPLARWLRRPSGQPRGRASRPEGSCSTCRSDRRADGRPSRPRPPA